MSRPSPRITVVTPSFNQAAFLERTIRSVLEQGYPNLEYIVMDGGSSDGSVQIIERYADRLAYWQSAPDGGQTAAINAGWRRGTGEILAWLNSDDYYLPQALKTVGEFMQRNPGEWVVYGRAEVVDEQGRHLGTNGMSYQRSRMVFRENCIPQPAAFVRREAVERCGYLDEALDYIMDADFFLRVAELKRPRFIPIPLAGMTWHKKAKSSRDRAPMAGERWAVRLRHARRIERPGVLAYSWISHFLHKLPPGLLAAADRARGIDAYK